ncbi:serine/threonine-protein kinase [Microbacterium sp. ARD31]|uniref:serine/threonine-protein kinase n=1 Tax=Microbacterium sp. ARD31 TaxID=2962576 RepID=UPI002882A057|nr:serine/threonine-protein kinase [Microbacterium sp. ARD31]MDT0180297.1 serine/threonine-protein kinase [Microbacterium sp. ARD31]
MTDLREVGDPLTGELLDGRYRLLERIGEGGMARVYRAEDTFLQRTTAVKVMRGHVDGLGSVERARSETTLLAGLNHHALVTLFDAQISADDGSYLVMEFVDGITLRDLIAQGPLSPQTAAALTAEIAEALHVAHTAGVVHRDIKPSNVLLGRSPVPGGAWRPKLADFGIAYLVDSTRVTTPGLMVGTIAYLAPEQANGAPPAPPADIYSLGIMVIEAISGSRPWADAEGIGALVARMTSPPSIPQSLPEEWQQLLRGMTATRPDDRPTALEVAMTAARLAGTTATGGAVDADTAPVAVVAVAPPVPQAGPEAPDDATALMPATSAPASRRRANEERRQQPRRRRALVALVIAIAVLAAALVVFFGVWASGYTASPEPAPSSTPLVQEVGPTPEPTVADEAPEEAEPAPAQAPAPAPEPAPEPAAPSVETAGNSGSGNGSANSGPGNNNGSAGGGNANSGPGNSNGAGGKGNGNG